MKGVIRFRKREKLNPCYVAYRLALTLEFVNVHNVFYVLMLRKYVVDPTNMLEQPPITLEKYLQYEKRPVQIMDTKVK